ncbi:MAG: PEP-CTERM sorting domain-containing protein [Lacunisphaera sp.]
MKLNYKSLAALAALSLAALSARAQTLDLVVGFAQSGAANDVVIDFGSVSGYSAGTYNLGNYASVLSSNFTNWDTSTGASAVQFGAVAAQSGSAGLNKAFPVWVTSSWDSTTNGTLGVQNSQSYTLNYSAINTLRTGVGKIDAGYGSFVSTGLAKQVSSADAINSWTANAQPAGTVALGFISAAQFNTGVSELANNGTASFAAADLYSVAVPTAGNFQLTFLGSLAVYQNGDITFTAIPEPSTYAALLGVVTLGVVAIRRRRQAALEV